MNNTKNQQQNPNSEQLGERKIIKIIQDNITPMPKNPVPFGDDIAAVNIQGEKIAALKTDMLVKKTDIPKGMTLWQAARKAIVMNVSDFAAKGATPQAVLVALGLPASITEKEIREIAQGLNAGAQEYGAYIIGGDTNQTDDLIISISLVGVAQKNRLMLRNGAKPGDTLAVTGFFGNPSAGLKLLAGKFAASVKLQEELLESVYMPKARLTEGLALAETCAVTASMDSSDGLAISLYALSEMSTVGFTLNTIPNAPQTKQFAKQNGLDADELALYGGEEYELVLTVKPELWAEAESAVKSAGGILLPIGKATKENKIQLQTNGEKKVIAQRGWEHFKSKA
jgi:thiamine-monophosphate kinase